MAMTAEMKAKRAELMAISQPFQMLVKQGAIASVNIGLATMYAEQGHRILKSFKEWQKEGFQVRKGSTALLMWGEPVERKGPPTEQEGGPEGESSNLFWPLAYLFSNQHVDKIK